VRVYILATCAVLVAAIMTVAWNHRAFGEWYDIVRLFLSAGLVLTTLVLLFTALP
jgi:hypothetical protein